MYPANFGIALTRPEPEYSHSSGAWTSLLSAQASLRQLIRGAARKRLVMTEQIEATDAEIVRARKPRSWERGFRFGLERRQLYGRLS
jgi:hypothetical protein